jgi:hypothetical protein
MKNGNQPGGGSALAAIELLDQAAARPARRIMTGTGPVPGAALRELLPADIPPGSRRPGPHRYLVTRSPTPAGPWHAPPRSLMMVAGTIRGGRRGFS